MAKFTRSRSCRLGLIVESGYLLVARWEAGLRGWQVATLETLPLMINEADALGKGDKNDKSAGITPEVIALTLKSCLEHWKLPPQTPAVVVPPLSVGGIFLDPVGGEVGKTPPTEVLAQNVPFAPEEIIATWCSGTVARKKFAVRSASGSHEGPGSNLRETARGLLDRLPWRKTDNTAAAAPENIASAVSHSAPHCPTPIFWLPRAWVERLCAALGRLGLRVEDFYHRGQLTAPALLADAATGQSTQSIQSGQWDGLRALVETFDNGAAAFYAWNDGLLCRAGRLHDSSAALAAEIFNLKAGAATDAQRPPGLRQLVIAGDNAEKFSAPPGVMLRRIPRPLDLSAQLFGLYCRSDAEGIWLPPPQKELLAPLTRNTIVGGVAGAAIVATFAWLASDAREESQALETSIKKIKPRFDKTVAQEKRAAVAAAALRFQEDVAHNPGSLDPLLSATQALPEKIWLHGYRWNPGGKVELSGDGASGADVVALLSKQAGWSQVRLVKKTEGTAKTDTAGKPSSAQSGAASGTGTGTQPAIPSQTAQTTTSTAAPATGSGAATTTNTTNQKSAAGPAPAVAPPAVAPPSPAGTMPPAANPSAPPVAGNPFASAMPTGAAPAAQPPVAGNMPPRLPKFTVEAQWRPAAGAKSTAPVPPATAGSPPTPATETKSPANSPAPVSAEHAVKNGAAPVPTAPPAPATPAPAAAASAHPPFPAAGTPPAGLAAPGTPGVPTTTPPAVAPGSVPFPAAVPPVTPQPPPTPPAGPVGMPKGMHP